ncbi:MAG: hypothetical protein Q8L48_01925 [Archangium sp.]|nr:hypothetical protein [Archangium sp.]
MKRFTMVAIGLLGVSCAQTRWYKQGATTAEFERERYECERDMRQSGYFGDGIAGAINMSDFFARCMHAHGWVKYQVDPNAYLALRNQEERRHREAERDAALKAPNAEAISEQSKVETELRRRKRGDAGGGEPAEAPPTVPTAKPLFGRCSEEDMRGMLKQGMSSSAINSACFE